MACLAVWAISLSRFTVAGGFTNHGAIELASGSGHSLVVGGGTLVNAPGALIHVVPTGYSGNGLVAELDNQGTLLLEGSLPPNGELVSLFIDPFGRPLSPVSLAGMNRRARRRGPSWSS